MYCFRYCVLSVPLTVLTAILFVFSALLFAQHVEA